MIKRGMVLSILVIMLFGCMDWDGQLVKPFSGNPQSVQAMLEQQIGILNYDGALATWGEPISVFDGDEVFVVTWGSEKVGPVMTSAIPIGQGAIAVTGQDRSGVKISATFNKETRRLVSITRIVW